MKVRDSSYAVPEVSSSWSRDEPDEAVGATFRDGTVRTPHGIVRVHVGSNLPKWEKSRNTGRRFSWAHFEYVCDGRCYWRRMERPRPFTTRGLTTMAARFVREITGEGL